MEPERLFARLYLDEDVHVRVARIVRGHGFSVRTTRDEDMLGATDEEQLAFAADHGLVVVTHNRGDFENLARRYVREGRVHADIIPNPDAGFGCGCEEVWTFGGEARPHIHPSRRPYPNGACEFVSFVPFVVLRGPLQHGSSLF